MLVNSLCLRCLACIVPDVFSAERPSQTVSCNLAGVCSILNTLACTILLALDCYVCRIWLEYVAVCKLFLRDIQNRVYIVHILSSNLNLVAIAEVEVLAEEVSRWNIERIFCESWLITWYNSSLVNNLKNYVCSLENSLLAAILLVNEFCLNNRSTANRRTQVVTILVCSRCNNAVCIELNELSLVCCLLQTVFHTCKLKLHICVGNAQVVVFHLSKLAVCSTAHKASAYIVVQVNCLVVNNSNNTFVLCICCVYCSVVYCNILCIGDCSPVVCIVAGCFNNVLACNEQVLTAERVCCYSCVVRSDNLAACICNLQCNEVNL